ncbi:toll/interleukin-1 receptor domain-containing protein [Acinetobacter sp. TY1]|uniref:toll/interleukin-1 receptor domain-containing protein n=1 Tax=Acinetobacter sp. TY1 TaxID=3387626 RepID=UPI003AF847B5
MRFFTLNEMKVYAENETSRFNISMESYFNETIKQQNQKNTFDIFLSHSSKDKILILGIKRFIEDSRYSVYIDWVDDPELDRTNVNKHTAEQLRKRMKQSKFLVYVDSDNAKSSKWMPWELGYFDGYKSEKLGILVIRNNSNEIYKGQEYLNLYPTIEKGNLGSALNNATINNQLFYDYFGNENIMY